VNVFFRKVETENQAWERRENQAWERGGTEGWPKRHKEDREIE
jgi:hypothetical protein